MADTQSGRLMQHADKAMSDFMALTEGLHLATVNPPLNLLVVDDDEHIREVCRTVAVETGMKMPRASVCRRFPRLGLGTLHSFGL